MTLTTAQMDSIIAAMKAKYPRDFGDTPTWEAEEARREIEEHGTAPLDPLAVSRAEVQRHMAALDSVNVDEMIETTRRIWRDTEAIPY